MPKKKTIPKKKIKVKLLKRLPKKLGDDAYAYAAALLEDVNNNFRTFAENQSILTNKVDNLTYEMGVVKEEITQLKIGQELLREDVAELKVRMSSAENRLTSIENRLTSMEERQTRMEADIHEIKQELKSIRSEMAELRKLVSQKVDIERFNRLEERVARIEQELQLRHSQ